MEKKATCNNRLILNERKIDIVDYMLRSNMDHESVVLLRSRVLYIVNMSPWQKLYWPLIYFSSLENSGAKATLIDRGGDIPILWWLCAKLLIPQ